MFGRVMTSYYYISSFFEGFRKDFNKFFVGFFRKIIFCITFNSHENLFFRRTFAYYLRQTIMECYRS